MQEVCLPVMSGEWSERKKCVLVQELRRISPNIVYLVFHRHVADQAGFLRGAEIFKANKLFLESHGFEVCAWFAPTIGYGGLAGAGDSFPYQPITTMKGEKTKNAFCPLDDEFLEDLAFQFTEIAKTGVKRILLEDDFTISGGKFWVQDMGCCCPLHLKELSKRLNKEIQSGEELRSYLTEGKPNPVRTAFLDLMGETLEKAARVVEKAVHSVDENIRIGLSANSASYHIEGADFFKLVKIVAGKNKPFMRITAAPYWRNGPSLNSIIETARMQNAWCKARGVDAMSEGDTYPRPAFLVPASYLEAYDMITRADNNQTGILKYMLDYTANADYETAYVDLHKANEKHYLEIEKRFQGKSVGLRVIEEPLRISEMDFDEAMSFFVFHSHGTLPLLSQWFVTDNCIPTTYEESDGACLAFGESARLLTERDLQKGVILDAKAAKILLERGVDLGIESMSPCKTPSGEWFPDYNDCTLVKVERNDAFFDFKLKDGAKVWSWFYYQNASLGVAETYKNGDERIPGCFIYQNSAGQKFLIYAFGAHQAKSLSEWNHGVFRNYYRQEQIAKGYEWMSGEKLPALLKKHANTYFICKKDGKRMHVGLWNISPDPILSPKVELDKAYELESVYGENKELQGEICGNILRFNASIAPYSFVFFTVKG